MTDTNRPAQPPPAPTIWRHDLASPWQRIGAVLLDGLILMVLFVPVVVLAADWTDEPESFTVAWWAYVVMFAIGFLYQVPPVALWGKSLGKLIVGITIVSARDLGRPGWWRAIRRWGIYVVAGLVPFIGGLLNLGLLLAGLVLLWAHEKRQTVHDMVADTLVVRNYAVPWRDG